MSPLVFVWKYFLRRYINNLVDPSDMHIFNLKGIPNLSFKMAAWMYTPASSVWEDMIPNTLSNTFSFLS